MVVRLGFRALVTALKPDLLITDEVLAVGDESFQNKCIAWMERYLADGGTLFAGLAFAVSRQKADTARRCGSTTAACAIGASHEVNDRLSGIFHEAKQAGRAGPRPRQRIPAALGQYAVTDLSSNVATQTALTPAWQPKSRDGRRPHVALGVVAHRRHAGLWHHQRNRRRGADETAAGSFEFALHFLPDWRLLPGAYRLRAHALDPEGMRVYDTVERDFTVIGDSRWVRLVRLASLELNNFLL